MLKSISILFLAIVMAACGTAPEKKVMIILVDGVPTDVLESVDTPILDQIAAQGGYTHAYQGGGKDEYTQTPTISAPGYMNMITGVWGNKHNVWGNSVRNPNYNYWNIFRTVKAVNPEMTTAIFSSWEDNRTKLVGEGKAEAGNFMFDYSFDGFELDTVAFPHTADRSFMFNIDENVSKGTADYVLTDAPNLSWVYLEFTDDMGHMYGDSPQMIEAVKGMDNQVGRIWAAIQQREREYNEDWMIVITTDHGRTESNGKGHGGQSERERTTWIVTNQNNLNKRFENNPPVVDVAASALRFLGIEAPEQIKEEMDGIPFIGDISIMNAKAKKEGNELIVSWEVADASGSVEIYQSSTNNFAKGGKDEYSLLGKADVKNGQFKTDFVFPVGTTKLLLKAPYNWTNVWVIVE
ncbi:type I phosphodiesterase/nucleotide pyrophosphatase [Roseivirga ehrenbergii]|uniref:Nucleotide pyrophosphatase n=1 Tax=Roseivirga ehrenbergii (strain DSM 102268 / JCM 13514 / KCTC 12282 / NCIMB 14502 / KMM 6017) TaxID=279360 RepID=A0A150X748_ROSEK|nr:alkaline phosphatase family protein [Roseivirga ehrenbergii]KYG74538.1 nucleotide pyrophosphatase [Roseivirga ehrenbergii]TCL14150.1 type I phosphodiesterase/nucleotide pyrophosphatase [Roseivirga ehrenbergii]